MSQCDCENSLGNGVQRSSIQGSAHLKPHAALLLEVTWRVTGARASACERHATQSQVGSVVEGQDPKSVPISWT